MITIRLAGAALIGLGVALASLSAQGQDKKDVTKQAVIKISPTAKYQEGLTLERAGRDAEAFEVFLQAARPGMARRSASSRTSTTAATG